MGQSVDIYCNSIYTTKWFFKGGQLPQNAVNLYNNSVLSIHNAQNVNDGAYTCYGTIGRTSRNKHFVAESILYVYGKQKTVTSYLYLIVILYYCTLQVQMKFYLYNSMLVTQLSFIIVHYKYK